MTIPILATGKPDAAPGTTRSSNISSSLSVCAEPRAFPAGAPLRYERCVDVTSGCCSRVARCADVTDVRAAGRSKSAIGSVVALGRKTSAHEGRSLPASRFASAMDRLAGSATAPLSVTRGKELPVAIVFVEVSTRLAAFATRSAVGVVLPSECVEFRAKCGKFFELR